MTIRVQVSVCCDYCTEGVEGMTLPIKVVVSKHVPLPKGWGEDPKGYLFCPKCIAENLKKQRMSKFTLLPGGLSDEKVAK